MKTKATVDPVNELITRQASVEATTYNADKRTVEVIFSTGAPVLRFDFEGQYVERLDLSPEACDLSDFIGGPVLDCHDRFTVRGVLGVIEAASVDGKRGVATIRFSERDDVQAIAKDVQTGIIRFTSVGYNVREYKDSKEANGVRVKTATKWNPRELSLVAIPADRGSTIRGEGMIQETQTPGAPAVTTPIPQSNEVQVREIGQLAGLTADQVTGMVQRNITPRQARAEAFDLMRQRTSAPIQTQQPAAVTARGYEDPFFLRNAMGEALVYRVLPNEKPSEAARPFIGMNLARMAEEFCHSRNVDILGLTSAGIIERALHTTSDFPALLGNLSNAVMRAALAAAPAAIKMIARKTTLPDFRSRFSVQFGEGPLLEKVNEAGEFKFGTVKEGAESYKLETFGKIFAISRQALVNDNLGAFTDMGRWFANSASYSEAKWLVDLITSNSGNGPKMTDTLNLFHANHGNIASSAAVISDVSLSEARLSMRLQKGLDGKTPLDIAPKFLLVPAALESQAEKYLAATQPAQASQVNPFSGKLELLVDPRLDEKSATRWYVVADPALAPVIEYAYLSGSEGVQTETRAGFEVDGVQVKARLDFGAGAIDTRGIFRNAGA